MADAVRADRLVWVGSQEEMARGPAQLCSGARVWCTPRRRIEAFGLTPGIGQSSGLVSPTGGLVSISSYRIEHNGIGHVPTGRRDRAAASGGIVT
ncbi:hypothetical protein [Streptomyces curacoi]|uniref:hypothetical protein n=1 Tax=Streptomyces curacoi TaxID=146536 RepID=UPI000AF165FE|nr:hypothetical protein [Streptomyces curacoi]